MSALKSAKFLRNNNTTIIIQNCCLKKSRKHLFDCNYSSTYFFSNGIENDIAIQVNGSQRQRLCNWIAGSSSFQEPKTHDNNTRGLKSNICRATPRQSGKLILDSGGLSSLFFNGLNVCLIQIIIRPPFLLPPLPYNFII